MMFASSLNSAGQSLTETTLTQAHLQYDSFPSMDHNPSHSGDAAMATSSNMRKYRAQTGTDLSSSACNNSDLGSCHADLFLIESGAKSQNCVQKKSMVCDHL